MQNVWRAGAFSIVLLSLAGCDNSANKPATPPSPPIHVACTTPEQAGQKAKDITQKLGEAATAKRINDDDYRAYNTTLGMGYQAWSEKQDLKAYCAALDKVVNDAGLK